MVAPANARLTTEETPGDRDFAVGNGNTQICGLLLESCYLSTTMMHLAPRLPVGSCYVRRPSGWGPGMCLCGGR